MSEAPLLVKPDAHARRPVRPVPLACLTAMLALGPSHSIAAPALRGVVVEQVKPQGAAARADLRTGDVLVSWTSAAIPLGPTQGRLEVHLDLAELEASHGQCGPVTVSGTRDGRSLTATLGAGEWGLDVRPPLAATAENKYAEAQDLLSRPNDVEKGIALLRTMAEDAGHQGEPATRVWLLVKVGQALAGGGRWDEAQQAFEQARELPSADEHRARLREIEARLLRARDPSWSRAAFVDAIELRKRAQATPLAVAADLNHLALLSRLGGDPRAAEALFREGWAAADAVCPGSLISADSIDQISGLDRPREEQVALLDRALAIRQRLAPESLGMARTLIFLAMSAARDGDTVLQEELLTRALELQERLEPDGLAPAATLNNLANVAWARGDYGKADELYRRSLALYERGGPWSVDTATTVHNLCLLADERGDYGTAEALCRRALAIAEAMNPGNASVATALGELADLARKTGRRAEAADLFRRAIALWERLSPEGPQVAEQLTGYARLLAENGDGAGAAEQARRALALLERRGDAGFSITASLQLLGDLAVARRDWAEAERHYGRALSIRSRLAPGSRYEAETLHALAGVRRESGNPDAALELSGRAVDALDLQRTRLGGSYEARARFSATAADAYRLHLDLLLERGETARAFHVLERSRARAFLDLLAERDLRMKGTATSKEEGELRSLAAEYDRVQASVTEPGDAVDAEAVARALRRMSELRDRRDALLERLRHESTQAGVTYAVPFDLAAARSALDPGTVLLAYAVQPTRTLAFVIEPAERPGPGLRVIVIDVGDAALREAVESFRRQMERGPSGDPRALERSASELYALLVAPVEPHLAHAQRLAVSPDGPLYLLPFSALSRRGEPLIAWKPLHLTPSATAYGETVKARRDRGKWDRELVAFGDPDYALQSGPVRRLRPLPDTRKEVQAIGALFPGRARVLLDRAASEEEAKGLGGDVRYVHFACHGLLDRRFPLDSALALSASSDSSGADNGQLQAWEILEGVRLKADLVTLSACESGLGTEIGGEGLLGLTRAFLHAGAHSVVASLWAISDRSTGKLMEAFYRRLANGAAKDEALRAAQVEMVRAGGTRAHPFYWAAFQLVGDWR